MVDRLDGLWHDAVVGGNDDHGHIGDLRAAGAHRGEGLMAGRIDEGDQAAAVVDLVGTDVLSDPAGLAADDVGLADRIEQRGLAVVDVAHDRHHGRAIDEVSVLVDGHLLDDLLIGVHDLDLLAELLAEDDYGLVRQRLGQGGHLAELHQLLDQFGAREPKRLRELADGHTRVDLGRIGLAGLGLDAGRRLFEDRAAAAPAAPGGPRGRRRLNLVAAGGLGVDDDAAALLRAARRSRTGAIRDRPNRRICGGTGGRCFLGRRRRGAAALEGLGRQIGVDAGGCRFGLDSRRLKRREHLLARQAPLLGDFVNALACHRD